jgi:hypothetical protein
MSYEFKVGDTGKTRGGADYCVLFISEHAFDDTGRSILAQLTDDGRRSVRPYFSNGSVGETAYGHHDYELIPPKKYVFVNVRLTDTGMPRSVSFTTEAAARAHARSRSRSGQHFIAVALAVEITTRKPRPPLPASAYISGV